MRLYIIKLKYNTMIKTLYFQAKDTKENTKKWTETIKQLKNIKKNSTNETEYITKTTQHFQQRGFQRVAK